MARAAAPKDIDLPKIPGLVFEKFEAGGISHYSYFIGHSSSVSMWGGWLLDPKRPIAMVTPAQGTALEVVRWLVRAGLEKFAGTLQGGMDAWIKQGGDFVTVNQMSVHELNQQTNSKDLQILDVRQPSEWDHGHVPNARYMFLPSPISTTSTPSWNHIRNSSGPKERKTTSANRRARTSC